MARQYKDFEVYLIHVDRDKCAACGECVEICQGDVFELSDKAYPARPQNCLGCQTCISVCEANAIIITEI